MAFAHQLALSVCLHGYLTNAHSTALEIYIDLLLADDRVGGREEENDGSRRVLNLSGSSYVENSR